MPAIRVPERWSRSTRPRIATPLCIAGLCVIALALTWVLAALVPATHFKDAVASYDTMLLGGPRLNDAANTLLHLLEPLPYALWGALLVVVALGRGRPRVALAVAIVLTLAPATAELLKPLLAHPHAWAGGQYVGAASWPSGHTTAGTILAMCAVLVAPARLRPLVGALGAAFALAVGFSAVLLAWHLPSDVLGGYLLATLWISLAVAGLRSGDARVRSLWLRPLGVGPLGVGGGVSARAPERLGALVGGSREDEQQV